MAESQVRQNYNEESEKGVNQQIGLELYAMYTYMSMVSLLFLPSDPTSCLAGEMVSRSNLQ